MGMTSAEQDEETKTTCPHCRGSGWSSPQIAWPPAAVKTADPLKWGKIRVVAVWHGCPLCKEPGDLRDDVKGSGRVTASVASTYCKGRAALQRLGAPASPR